jgi:hypothetical protein
MTPRERLIYVKRRLQVPEEAQARCCTSTAWNAYWSSMTQFELRGLITVKDIHEVHRAPQRLQG